MSNYFRSIEWFRGLAIIFVFITHCLGGNGDTNPIIFSIFYNGTFIFVVITGFLFWHLIDRYDFKNYIYKKIKFVIVPYILILGIPYIVFNSIVNVFGMEDKFSISIIHGEGIDFYFRDLAYELLVGGNWLNQPLWFIPMIFLFFLTTPIIKLIAESKYFKPTLIFFLLVSLFSFRPDKHNVPIYCYVHFFGVFLFGIFLKQRHDFIISRASLLTFYTGIAYIIFIFLDTWMAAYYGRQNYIPLLDGHFTISAINIIQIQKLFAVVFFLSLLSFIENKYKGVQFKFLSFLATYSFGIFFIHQYWIIVCRNLLGPEVNYLLIILTAFPSTIVSLLVAKKILDTLNLNSKYFIGV